MPLTRGIEEENPQKRQENSLRRKPKQGGLGGHEVSFYKEPFYTCVSAVFQDAQ